MRKGCRSCLLALASLGCGEGGDPDAGSRAPGPAVASACVENSLPPATRVRRLSKVELQAATAALLARGTTHALDNVEADPQIDGRYSNSDQLVASASFLGGLNLAADLIGTDFKARVTSAAYDSACFTSDAAAEACAQTFIRSFGSQAYRRALTDEDVAQLMPVYTAGREVGIDADVVDRFATGLSWLVRAMVQAPDFMYVKELGDPAAPNGSTTRMLPGEIASALSFSVVGMPPDPALATAAAERRVDSPAERVEQASRLIAAYPEGWKRQMRLFVTQWLGINFEKPEWEKDAATVPRFSASLKDALRTETELLLDEWATGTDGARLDTLLTGNSTFVNELNAPLYGLSAIGPTFQKANLDGTQRAGILTLGGFLGSTSHVGETSPVLRGIVIMKRLLCSEPEPPPPDVPPLPPPDAAAPTTTRARYEEHAKNPTCKGCHERFDPMGNTFEAYDVLGAYRTEQNGFPIDSSGALVTSDGQRIPVENAVELVNELAGRPEVRACVARQLFRFTTGRDAVAYDGCTLDDATRTLTAGSGALRDVVLSIVGSEAFVTRTVNR
jgi:hypothetical protein